MNKRHTCELCKDQFCAKCSDKKYVREKGIMVKKKLCVKCHTDMQELMKAEDAMKDILTSK